MNEPLDEWQDIATVWADVRPLSGRELEVARQLVASATHRVVIRGGRDVRPDHRFLFGRTSRALHPESVLRVGEQSAWLLITASERL